MSVAENGQFSDGEFAIEDMWLGVFSTKMLASGFGQVGDGRSFAFCIEGQSLVVELYRPRLRGPGSTARRRRRDHSAQRRRHRHHRRAQPGRRRARCGRPGRSRQLDPTHAPGTVVVVTATPAMSWWQVVVLAVVQGLTEFLPVSSSGHLAIVSRVFFAGDAGASFTAVTQLGTEAAVLVYFARDIVRIVAAWFQRSAGRRASRRRLPAGLVRDHRDDSDLCPRSVFQRRDPLGRA